WLRAYHPNLYAHTGPKRLRGRFKGITSSVEGPMTFWQAAAKAQQMLVAVCDEHTSITLSRSTLYKRARRGQEYPVPLVVTPRRMFRDTAFNTNRAVGEKNLDTYLGLSASKLHRLIKELSASDGCLQQKAVHTARLDITTQLLLSTVLQDLVPDADPLTLQEEVSQADGIVGFNVEAKPKQELEIEEFGTLQTKTEKQIYDIIRDQNRTSDSITLQGLFQNHSRVQSTKSVVAMQRLGIRSLRVRDLTKRANTRPPIWSRYSQDGKVALVVVETLNGTKSQEHGTNTILRTLITANPEHVILDLSRLPGGSVREASRILSYFLRRSHRTARSYHRRSVSRAHLGKLAYTSPDRKKAEADTIRQFRRVRRKGGLYTLTSRRIAYGNPSYRGRLTVIVSPKTRSAATMMALILQRQANATVVGYQNAGDTDTSCLAAPGKRTLPKTGIVVSIPTTCFRRSRVKGKRGGPLKVDIEVSPLAVGFAQFLPSLYDAAADDVLKARQ
ncbi:MAG: S41 family peptidase, partial [Pseudomonadota bacterium]